VGLSLVLGLARADRSVLVPEQEPSTSDHSQAPILWPRTQEIFADLGVLDRFLDAGIVRSEVQLWDADRNRVLLQVPIEELGDETRCPHLLLCPQSTTEELLCDAVRDASSAEVRFSAEVTEVTPQSRGVEVRYERDGTSHTATASFVAGCDGAHSRVRDIIGASFEGRTYSMQTALADPMFEDDPDMQSPRMTRRRGVAAGIRIDEHEHRWHFHHAPHARRPYPSRPAHRTGRGRPLRDRCLHDRLEERVQPPPAPRRSVCARTPRAGRATPRT